MFDKTTIAVSPAAGLRIPDVARLAASLIIFLAFYGGVRNLLVTGHLPLLWPVVAAFLSATLLLTVNRVKDPAVGLARLGFHVGLFAYFLSLPVLFPETIEPGLPDSIHQTIGLMLVLTILGFESGYKLKSFVWTTKRSTKFFPVPHAKQGWLLGVLICAGLASWFLTTVDYSLAAQVSVWDILLSMRGKVDSGIENPVTQFGVWSYLLAGGLYLATAAAFLLLTNRRKVSPLIALACWSVVILCAVLGFLSGSRALFLYSFAPLALACWVRLSAVQVGKAFRLLAIFVASALIITVWLAMSSMRGHDVRTYEGSLEDIQPFETARGAFDIYTSSAVIIESFPDEIDYEYGRSLLPLVLGWFPRSLWPGKPYPFSMFANKIRGETLQDRAASIAVGLPGEGYGNFGLAGVFLWGLLMGLACRFADDYLKRFAPSDPLRLFIGVSMCIWAAMIVRGGVPEMFYMGMQTTIFPICLSVVLNAIGRRSQALLSQESRRRFESQKLPVSQVTIA
jgi:oligosaccharide repeat unit polymerase